MVLFPTILILMLQISPSNYGLAQVSLLAPSIFLIVLGGTIADRTDTRILLFLVHLIATTPLFLILFAIYFNFLSFEVMIFYGLVMGCASAFALPSRESLLTSISHGQIQRTVTIAMITQFSFQLIGMFLGTTGTGIIIDTLLAYNETTTNPISEPYTKTLLFFTLISSLSIPMFWLAGKKQKTN